MGSEEGISGSHDGDDRKKLVNAASECTNSRRVSIVKNGNIDQLRSNGSKPIRVLMADPDESLHPLYREPLSREGFEVDRALNGLECVSRLRERRPDVLVLEPQLPWGGGDGVLAMMGEDPQFATVPVMVLTSCRDPHILKAVTRFPVSDYQLKPLAPNRLARRLHALLDHRRLRFDLAEQNGRLEGLIAQRTGGRVWNLSVETIDGRIMVHGRSNSHHVKQLALTTVLEVFEASPSQTERVDFDIEVVPDNNWQARQCVSPKTKNDNDSNEFALTKEN
jgi:DNA-binding response OmpR family regulator